MNSPGPVKNLYSNFASDPRVGCCNCGLSKLLSCPPAAIQLGKVSLQLGLPLVQGVGVILQSEWYTVYCTLYSVHCTVYSVHCTHCVMIRDESTAVHKK